MVKEHTAGLSDDAMRSATGRHPAEWFALLDEAGAAGWGHTRIAGWLVAEHGVARWWNQAAFGGDPASSRAEGKRPFARWKTAEGSVLVTAEVAAAKVRVSAVHERLAGPEATEPAKEELVRVLGDLAS